MDAQLWATIGSMIAAIAAAAAALISYLQNRTAAKTNTAQIYLEFSRRYNAPEIPKAIENLKKWQKKHPADFAKIFFEKLIQHEPEAMEADFHRRTLNRYFVDIADAYKAGILQKKFACLAADQPGASIWRHIVVPMNMVLYNRPDSRSLKRLQSIVPDIGQDPIF